MTVLDTASMQWRKSERSAQGGDSCVELAAAVWRKSSHSGQGGQDCVELASLADAVAVRDSKDPEGPKLTLDSGAFSALVSRIRSGRHDL
ncbi:DUF397 domain-containing protein [Spirillospora sp. CA-294931]|uniref:DUF397 domain-containing protein n=1 Tax=Spirillospora sp. CA-294931 TaxID=3240042 RepID=UPI003D8F8808